MEQLKDKLAYSIDEFCQVASISRTAIYKAIAAGDLKTYKLGKRRMVSRRAAEAFIARLESQAQAAA